VNLEQYLRNNRLHVHVKPNAPETKLQGYDKARDAVTIAVAAPPENNKANIALLKFVKKQLGRPVALKSGATSRDKVIEVG
jgi:uncharacterized protein (TIGR00251 family)